MQITRQGPTRITRQTIDTVWRRRSPGTRAILLDLECRGLALVVNATSMAWSYSYKPRGLDPATGKRFATKSLTLGNPETHSPEAARAAAFDAKAEVGKGRDPAAERKARIAKAVAERSLFVDRLVADYARGLPLRRRLRGPGIVSPSFAAEEVAHVRAAVAVMKVGGKPIAEINAADLRLSLRADPGRPNAARHRLNALRRFLDWARDEGLLSVNPCEAIPKARRPRPPASRAHCLSLAQCAALWRAAGALPAVWRDFVRFLIAVPCRRGEAASLDWAHVDLAAAAWSQPAKLTKNREPHRLHLHPPALAILAARYEAAGRPASGLVFPAPRSAQQIVAFSGIARALKAAAPELVDIRLHDLRRSFATALGEAGAPEVVADAILNHKQSATRGGVLGVYQGSTRWGEQVAAMQHWGRLLSQALSPHRLDGEREPAGEILPFVAAASGGARTDAPYECPDRT
jgi:integrase